jgi:hypothetical protein
MKLLSMMRERAGREESYFQAALLREDVQRLEKLCTIAEECETLERFHKDGLYVGWTQGDLRTGELKEALSPFMEAFYAYAHEDKTPAREEEILRTWAAFNQQRMKILVHCL